MERKWQPTPVFLPGESLGQGSLVGYSPWGHKELETTEKTIASTRRTFVAKVVSLLFNMLSRLAIDFPGGSDGKASAYNAGDLDSVPGSGRSPGEGNGNSLQYSCLENPTDRGAW